MTTLTPEELAACREAFEATYGTDFDLVWSIKLRGYVSGQTQYAYQLFCDGLSHARAEAAKEIADLKAQLERYEQHGVTCQTYRHKIDGCGECNRHDCAELKAQVEGMRKLLRRYREETPLGHQPHMIAHLVDAAIAQEKQNDR